MKRARPCRCDACCASATCAPVRLEQPIWRTLPCRTRSSSARKVSSIGVAASRPVQLVEIDPIGAQPLQARLDGARDVAARGARDAARAIRRHAELGRQHHLLAPLAERLDRATLPRRRHCRTSAVSIRVTPRSSARCTTARVASRSRRPAEIVAAEPDDRDFERRNCQPYAFPSAFTCHGRALTHSVVPAKARTHRATYAGLWNTGSARSPIAPSAMGPARG